MQTNVDEIQKLGEQLRELVTEVRPMIKDLNKGLREYRKIEDGIKRALDLTKEQLEDAARLYDINKEIEKSVVRKMEGTIQNLDMIKAELANLQRLHLKVQDEMVLTVGKYVERKKL